MFRKIGIAVIMMMIVGLHFSWAQETAITESGKKVLLNSDGTWKYIEISEKNGATFRKVPWGLSKEDVKKIENKEVAYENDKALWYSTSLAGLKCSAIYVFAADKFIRGRYYIDESHSNNNDYIDDYDKLKQLLKEKYGEPLEDKQIWKDDLYKNDYSEWGIAVASGKMFYYATWENEDSKIEIQLWGDNFRVKETIDYTSKIFGDLENQLNNQKAKDDL